MAWEIPGFQRGWVAGGTAGTAGSDLSLPNTVNSIAITSYQYMFVQLAAGLLAPVSSLTANTIVGVLQNKPAPGQAGTVMISGVTRCRSDDSALTVGSKAYVDVYGFVKSTGTPGACVGVCEEVAATSTGYMVAICLKPFGALYN